ncbi:MAG: hypothetical protein ACOX6P_08390 [Candidatus Merdivicinus sp.]|jgi:phosphomannomutase
MTGNPWQLEEGVLSRKDRLYLTAADSLRAGMALAAMGDGKTFGMGYAPSPAAKALILAAESGILQNSGNIWDFGDGFESRFCYCLSRSGADYGIFVDFSGELHLYTRGGLPMAPEGEQKFLLLLNLKEQRPVFAGDWGHGVEMENLRELYRIELIKAAETTLTGMTACVKCANPLIQKLMEETLAALGCRVREGGIILQISADGRQVSAYETVRDDVHTERILCLVCQDLFRRGQDAAVPASSPRMLDRMATEMGRKVFRYADGIPSVQDRKARNLSLRQPFLRDGLMLGLRLLSILRRNRCTLAQLERQLPDYTVITRKITMSRPIQEGAVFPFAAGEIRLRPIRGGKTALLMAESRSMEAAAELCRFWEESQQP